MTLSHCQSARMAFEYFKVAFCVHEPIKVVESETLANVS